MYIKTGAKVPVAGSNVEALLNTLWKRAKILNLDIDEKFRNVAGLNMQLACMNYVATGGKEGGSGASDLFYDTYEI